MKEIIITSLKKSIEVKQELIKNYTEVIEQIAIKVLDVLKKEGKIIIFGNGGSAADSQHMAAELVGRFKKERKALPAIALSTNASIITSLANDYNYSSVFLRQIEALGREGDIALGISTSGKSENVIRAIKIAKQKGLITIGLTGKDGGELAKICNLALVIPSSDTARIQEAHITCIHILCDIIEDNLFKD